MNCLYRLLFLLSIPVWAYSHFSTAVEMDRQFLIDFAIASKKYEMILIREIHAKVELPKTGDSLLRMVELKTIVDPRCEVRAEKEAGSKPGAD